MASWTPAVVVAPVAGDECATLGHPGGRPPKERFSTPGVRTGLVASWDGPGSGLVLRGQPCS